MSIGPQIPVTCPTIELKDLADTIDFDANAIVGSIYGFEFTQNGYYKRALVPAVPEVPSVPPSVPSEKPSIDQLKDFNAGKVDPDFKYAITKRENIWSLTPVDTELDWLIKFKCESPYTFIGPDNKFKKIINAGPMLVSLVPDENNRETIEVKAYKKSNYVLHKRETAGKNVRVILQPPLQLGSTAMIVLDIIAHRPTQRNFNVIPQVSLSWVDLDEDPRRVTVFMKKRENENQFSVFTSSPKITFVPVPNPIDRIAQISLDNVDLLAFYFSDQIFSDSQIEYFANKLKSS